jgi:hypothetical protein
LVEWPPRLPTEPTEEKLERGYKLIFTSPYTPSLKLIELTWSNMKWYVANRFHLDRTKEQTRQQIFIGFYGDENDYNGCTSKTCRSHVEKCEKHCNYFIQNDPQLSGTIRHLNYDEQPLSEPELMEIEEELSERYPFWRQLLKNLLMTVMAKKRLMVRLVLILELSCNAYSLVP